MAPKSKTDKFATKYPGVYKKYSKSRRNPKDGKPDEGFVLAVRITEDGKYIKKWLYVGWKSEGMTADKANDLLVAVKKQIKAGEPPQAVFERVQNGEPVEMDPRGLKNQERPPLTFGEAWDIYDQKWAPNLAWPKNDIWKYKKHIEPRFAHMPMDKIKSLDLEDLKLELLKAGNAPATVKNILGLMGRVYNKMTAWEYYDGPSPVDKIKMPKVDNARVRYLSHEEADKLMEALDCRYPVLWRIATLSLQTGMRLGEVMALTRGDIDFQGRVIHVQHGKTGSRMVQMNDIAEDALKQAINHSSSDRLFPQRNCDLARRTTAASTLFGKVVKELGFNPKGTPRSQKVVFHSLRHTFASWLVMEGVPLYTVSKLLGHASLTMTYRYAHLAPDNQKDAVNLLAALTGRNKPRPPENQQAA